MRNLFLMAAMVLLAADGLAAPKGPPAATVVPLAAAPVRSAPSGKARIQKLALGRNAFIGRLELAPGAKVPQHRDATEEYIHVLEGHGVITIDGAKHEVKAGTTIYMPANAQVSYQNGDARLVAVQVFAGPGPAKKYRKWKEAE